MRQTGIRPTALRRPLLCIAFFCSWCRVFPEFLFAQDVSEIFIQSTSGGIIKTDSSQFIVALGQAAPIGVASGGSFKLLSGHVYALDAAPSITHAPLSVQTINREILVEANITDDTGVANAALIYRRSGEKDSIKIEMSNSGTAYRGRIPANDVTARGVEYYFIATDSVGNQTRQPVNGIFSIQVAIAEPGLVKADAQPNGVSATAYRLFSIPLDLDNKNPAAVLEDDLGKYKDTKWRCAELLANQTYGEFPNIAALMPGKAFWLLVKEAGKVIDTGGGKSNRTDGKYAVALHPQWNFIGNPFNFAIPASNLRLQSNNQTPEWVKYNGAWSNPLTEKISAIEPFEGYAIYNDSPTADTLLIDPNLTATFAFTPETVKPLWAMVIRTQSEEAVAENVLAVVAGASPAWDKSDYPEPPGIDENVTLYFPHPEWNRRAQNYSVDARPEFQNGEVWEFTVKTGAHEKVQLNFDGIASVPEKFEIWLVDEALQLSQNLRQENHYALAGTASHYTKRLKIILGKHDFIAEKLSAATLLPARYEFTQNFPNPFNPTTTIRYGLPQAGKVTLKIYNLLGEEVMTLVDNAQKAAGYHVAIWDGRNLDGRILASGVYILRLQANDLTITKKMTMSK